MQRPSLTILLAEPRGFCAGVQRAVEIVEKALAKYGAPVYVRREIVHNRHVVADLEAQGAVFIEELDQAPTIGRWCCRLMACRKRCRPKRRAASSPCSTPPARWSRRCIARPSSISRAAARSS